MDDKSGLWWRLVHLEPTALRGAVTGIVGLMAALGVLIAPGLPDALLGALVPTLAVVQILWVRPAVTANARVSVEVPDPVNDPGRVTAGDAVTTATSAEIVTAARMVPRG
jgi:hypothetical protein